MHKKIKKIIIILFIFLINTVNSKTFSIQSALLDNYKISENIFLNIPCINFYKSFDSNSTLKDNLELEKSSVMPNENDSTVIILGHSGYNYNAYFNDLFKLNVNDFIYLKYLGKTYTYKIINIEYINKNEVYKVSYKQNYLYLVTCDLHDFSKQVVIKSSKI